MSCIIMKTYILKKRKERKSIRDWVGTLKAQSPTYYGKAMARSVSARGSALYKHNHSLAVRRQWQDHHQQVGLHFVNTTTYWLWEGNSSISKGVCTLQAPSLTFCGKVTAASASASGSALCKHNHLLAVGRQ